MRYWYTVDRDSSFLSHLSSQWSHASATVMLVLIGV
jgi:hypothetical protein